MNNKVEYSRVHIQYSIAEYTYNRVEQTTAYSRVILKVASISPPWSGEGLPVSTGLADSTVTVLYTTLQNCTLHYSTVKYSAERHSTAQQSTVQYSAVKQSRVQNSSLHKVQYNNSVKCTDCVISSVYPCQPHSERMGVGLSQQCRAVQHNAVHCSTRH